MVREFWEYTTLETLQSVMKQGNNKKITVEECAKLMTEIDYDGNILLQEHRNDYGEILLHVLASDMVTEPLLDLLNKNDDKTPLIECYILLIEIMWKMGDEAVRNVVDVTILERLSDEDSVWQKFGSFISLEFKNYINKDVLTTNLMMSGVKNLK